MLEIFREGPSGTQFEVNGVLVTMRLDNPHYVLHGSVLVNNDDGTLSLTEFHNGESGTGIVFHKEVTFTDEVDFLDRISSIPLCGQQEESDAQ